MENSAWAEQHFVVGDDYGCFRLAPNPDGESNAFKDGAVLFYRNEPAADILRRMYGGEG